MVGSRHDGGSSADHRPLMGNLGLLVAGGLIVLSTLLSARNVAEMFAIRQIERSLSAEVLRLGAEQDTLARSDLPVPVELADGPDRLEALLGAEEGSGVRILPAQLRHAESVRGSVCAVRLVLTGEFNTVAALLEQWERGPISLTVTSLEVRFPKQSSLNSRWTVSCLLEGP